MAPIIILAGGHLAAKTLARPRTSCITQFSPMQPSSEHLMLS